MLRGGGLKPLSPAVTTGGGGSTVLSGQGQGQVPAPGLAEATGGLLLYPATSLEAY